MNENAALKLSINEKPKPCSNECSRNENRHYRKKHESFTCFNYGRKGHMSYNCFYMKNDSPMIKKIWVPKGFRMLTNY